MAVQDYVRSESFDYPEAPDSLAADVAENSSTLEGLCTKAYPDKKVLCSA